MSWMNVLYETYDKIAADEEKRKSLSPMGHMFANAQLEVALTREGDFAGAKIIDKDDSKTLIPVTESSAARSSGIAPHPLCDQLQYIAGDFGNYCEKEKDKKLSENKFNEYIEGLKNWAESENSHEKVQIICKYLLKGRLMEDLIKSGIVKLDENGFLDKSKISGQTYEKVFVRFRVFGFEGQSGTWEDISLINAYTDYYFASMPGDKHICYITGEEKTIMKNHPKGIIPANYGAKLVSANDGKGYTYRGRFQDKVQACTVSYEASQRVHGALKWLVEHQGAYVENKNSRVFVCFNPEGKKVPNTMDALFDFEDEELPETDNGYRSKLKDVLSGYENRFNEEDSVVIMSLDTPTEDTGRLSVTYYNQLMASEFLKRVEYWYESCNWKYPYYTSEGKRRDGIKTPVFKDIARYAFGTKRGDFIELDKKLLNQQVQRLVKCMIDKNPFPADIMRGLFMKASNLIAYSDSNGERVLSTKAKTVPKRSKNGSVADRERVLSTACAVIRKYHYDRGMVKEGEKTMSLDYENKDRSYLFGRLLAVYERAEEATYEKGEKRTTNAMRMQAAFVNHPFQTWKILENKMNPYYMKLDKKSFPSGYYKKIVEEITSKLADKSTEALNRELTENYLLGYYLQRAEFFKKKENDDNL